MMARTIVLLVISLTCSGCLFPSKPDPEPTPVKSPHEGHYRADVPVPSDTLKEATKSLLGIISDPVDAVDAAQC